MSGTTGTVQTDTALLNEFADGQAAGAIVPQYVRNVIVSKTAQIATALPSATTSQLYGGTGAAGAAAAVTLGSGLTLTSGTLTASGSGGSAAPSVFTVYTASGALSLSDDVSIVNSASNLTMTLANGTSAKLIRIKRYGAGTVTVTATIDGTTSQSVQLNTVGGAEMLTLMWDAALTTWIMD
jgi:hypothetical protein